MSATTSRVLRLRDGSIASQYGDSRTRIGVARIRPGAEGVLTSLKEFVRRMPKPMVTSGVVVHDRLMQLTTHSPEARRSSRPGRHHHGVHEPASARTRDARRGGGPEDSALYSCMCGYRLQGGGDDLGRLPALRDRAGLVARRGDPPPRHAQDDRLVRIRPGRGGAADVPCRRRGTKRARGIEPPSLAWEANVLAIGQRPRGAQSIPSGAKYPLRTMRAARLLARHPRRRAARRAARLRAHDHRDRHDARRRDGPRRAASRRRTIRAAAARRRRRPARSPTTRARSCWSTSGPRGASRAATSCR